MSLVRDNRMVLCSESRIVKDCRFKFMMMSRGRSTLLVDLGLSKWISDIGYSISKLELSGNWIPNTQFFGFRDQVRV